MTKPIQGVRIIGSEELLERAEELQILAGAQDAAVAGLGMAVLLVGFVGAGKTALIRAAVDLARARGSQVLKGTGAEIEREFPFGIVRQIFGPALARASTDESVALLAGPAARAARVLTDSVEEAPHGSAGVDDFAALNGLYWLTANLADRGPLLIAVDDAQWADPPTLRFLDFLARRLEGLPVTLLVAARMPEAEADPLIEGLARSPGTKVIQPKPLTEEGSATLLARQLDSPPDPAFASASLRATGGNPLLLTELAATARAEGIEPTAANAATIESLSSEGVARALLTRVGALGPAASALALAVAVLGGRAELAEAAELAELEVDAALASADDLVRGGFMVQGRPLAFAHPIVATAISNDLPLGDANAAHRRAAEILARRRAAPEQVGAHLLAVEPSGDEWVANRLRSAATAALEHGGADAALHFLRRARAEPPPERDRAGVVLELGAAAARAGAPDALELMREAFELADEPRTRAQVAVELGATLSFAGRSAEAARILAEVLESVDPDDPSSVGIEALLLTTGATTSAAHRLVRGRFDAAEARAATLPPREANLLLAPVALERVVGDGAAGEGAALARRALAEGRLIAAVGVSPTPLAAVLALLFADDLDPVSTGLGTAIEKARAISSARGLVIGYVGRALVHLARGDLADAEADAEASLEIGAGAQWGIFRMLAGSVLARTALERGDLEGARRQLEAAARVNHDPDALLAQPLRDCRARLYFAEDRPQAALEELLAARSRQEAWETRSPAPLPWRAYATVVKALLGELGEAHQLADEAEQDARRFGTPRMIGIALRGRGLVQRGDAGIESLRDALDAFDASPSRLDQARTRVILGEMLRRAGKRREARTELAAGIEIARACGATALVERGYEELEATGARPRKVLRTGVDSLTASERRVARLAAEGRSNREVAEALFVTVKTVETHMGQVFRKLEIRSRSELPAALGQEV